VAALLVGAVAASVITGLVAGATGWEVVRAWDHAALEALAARRSPTWDHAALAITALGNTLTLAVLVLWAAVLLLAWGQRATAVVLLVAFGVGRLLTEALKAVIGRPRPEVVDWLAHTTSLALPSAHAMSATIVYAGLAYLSARALRARIPRFGIWALAALTILAVSVSRVYLGVHYPSDVVAGILAGAAWTAAAFSALPPSDSHPSRRGGAHTL
jgi:membrane-associated phospholipid phosphatase